MLEFLTLEWFFQSQLDRQSITYKFTNFGRKLAFSFDPEKARLFEPSIKCISFEEPLTGVQLTLQNCICRIVVNRLPRWRKPFKISFTVTKNEVNYAFEVEPAIIPSCSSLIISSVI